MGDDTRATGVFLKTQTTGARDDTKRKRTADSVHDGDHIPIRPGFADTVKHDGAGTDHGVRNFG